MPILPVALCPRLSEALVIDGRLEEGIWSIPPAIPFFVRPRVRWVPEAQTQVFTAYDDKALNIGFRCFEDAVERIEGQAGPPDADALRHDDLIGFRFATESPGASHQGRHFIITAGGGVYEEREEAPGRYAERADFECAVSFNDLAWSVEARMPWGALGTEPPNPGERWGFTAYRLRVGSRLERSGWLEVGPGPFHEPLPGWLIFESPDETEGRRARAVEPYLRRFGDLLAVRMQQAREAEARLKEADCPVTRYRVKLMIGSLLAIKNDMPHSYHPDALRHYSQALQFNLGRLDELIECLRQGEDPLTSADGYVFLGAPVAADGANHAYAVVLGRDYDWTSPHPAIVLLHGLSDDWIADSRAFAPLAWPKGLDFVMAVPSGLGLSRSYRLAAEDEIFSVLRKIRTQYSVDRRRIFIIGVGEGAEAARRLAGEHPHLFVAGAGAGPLSDGSAPGPRPFFLWTGPEGGWIEAPAAGEFPPPGGGNPIAPPSFGLLSVARVVTPELITTLVSAEPAIPRRIEIIASSPRRGRGVWARIDLPRDYSRPARLALEADKDGLVKVDAENVGSFTLFPAEGPFVAGQPLRVEADGRLLGEAIVGKEPLAFHPHPPPAGDRVKRPGLSGPIDEGFHGPLLYVYGTNGDEPTRALMREAAFQACRWPSHDLRIPVKADTEVGEREMAGATLHLFGGLRNRLVARMAADLPVAMRENSFALANERFDAMGHVCQFIFPNPLAPERLAVIHLANSPEGWLYRGWHPKAEQPEPLPDLWVARIEDNPDIGRRGVAPHYLRRVWFDAGWRLA